MPYCSFFSFSHPHDNDCMIMFAVMKGAMPRENKLAFLRVLPDKVFVRFKMLFSVVKLLMFSLGMKGNVIILPILNRMINSMILVNAVINWCSCEIFFIFIIKDCIIIAPYHSVLIE